MNIYLKIFIWIVVLLLVVLGVVFFATRKVVAAGDKFVGLLATNTEESVHASYDLLTSNVKAGLAFEGYTNIFNGKISSAIIPPATWMSRRVTYEGGSLLGELKGVLVLEDGNKKSIELELRKENGEWKISYLAIKEIEGQ